MCSRKLRKGVGSQLLSALWGVFYVLEYKAAECSSQFWWNHLLGEKEGDLREAGKGVFA